MRREPRCAGKIATPDAGICGLGGCMAASQPAKRISAAALAVSLKARLYAWMDGRGAGVRPCVHLREGERFRNTDAIRRAELIAL
jgi:hypothetical protein